LRRIVTFILFMLIAVAGWIVVGYVGALLATGRAPLPRGADWWRPAVALLAALLGTWGALRSRPRTRSSSAAVDEFIRTKRRRGETPPAGTRRGRPPGT
jgi:hypothetical protein